MNTQSLVQKALACQLCKGELPHAPKPIFIWPEKPKIILISQAPGRLAHQSGIAWNDASGERLRAWLGVDRQQFYEAGVFAVLPMSFCFPGYKNGADAPPLRACAPAWHAKFLATTKPALTICIGRYAQKAYLPEFASLTDAVSDFQSLLPSALALPHPSGRNNRWLSKHPWFEDKLVADLQKHVKTFL